MNFFSEKKENGFTLLEVLIALIILGIGLMPLIASELEAQNSYMTVNLTNKEVVLAKNIMSNIELYGNIFPLDKKGTVKSDKSFNYREVITSAAIPGVYQIKVYVFKKGSSSGSGVVLKMLSGS